MTDQQDAVSNGAGAHDGESRAPGDGTPPVDGEGAAEGVLTQHAEAGTAKVANPAKKAATKRLPAKKAGAKKAPAKAAAKKAPGRMRVQRSFPASTFEDSLELARQIQNMGSNKVRRLTLFDEMDKSPDSGASRQLITNSNRYGLTKGSYAAEFIELTDDGYIVVSPEAGPKEKARASFRLAIEGIPPFQAIYEEYAGKRLPTPSVVKDFLLEKGYADEEIQECIDTFTVNAKYAGVLKVLSGAEQLLKLDHALDELPARGVSTRMRSPAPRFG